MTEMKMMKSIDTIVEVMMKGIKNLEVIIENLNDKVASLEINEIQLKEHIDMLISKLGSNKSDKEPDKLETNWDKNVETHDNEIDKHPKLFQAKCTKCDKTFVKNCELEIPT